MRAALFALTLFACGGSREAPAGGGGAETATGDGSRGGEEAAVPDALACASHDDCVLLPGVCGGVVPTNRSHEAETRESIRVRQSVVSCAAILVPEPVMVARCNAGRCMAIEPP